jgi:hypothetical protein
MLGCFGGSRRRTRGQRAQALLRCLGRVVKADYAIINRSKAVTVATLRSCRSTECANQNPELAAKALLREMAAEGMA